MTDWRQALVVCLIIGSALLVAGPPAHALDGESEEMWARLSEIGLRVDRCLHNIRHDAERGLGDRTLTTIEAESASVALDGIEKRLRQLPVENGQPLLEKLASIRLQLGNLQRAAIRPETVPPSPTKANARIVHKGRQPGMTDAPPANDDCSGAFSVGLGTFAGSTAEATNDGEATCGASIFSPDVWYLFFAYTTGYVVFDTVGSSYDTVLSVHSECPGTMANESVCNDDSLGIHASVRTYVYAGSEYLIRVSGVNGDSGPYALNISTGGGISGRVADGVATNPIAGARVEYFNDAGYYMTSVSSASDGTFIISGLESGEYFVGTDLYSGSWIDELYDDHPCPGGPPYGCDPQSGDPVTVVAGSVTAGIDFVLEEAGQITGLILEEGTGEAIQGAAIRIYDSVGGSFGSDYSDAIGEYRVEGLSGGTYFAVVTTGLSVTDFTHCI